MKNVTCQTTTGITQYLPNEEVTVYPNPVTEALHVDLSNTTYKAHEIVLYNTMGQIVYQTNTTSQPVSINTSELQRGMYYLYISNIGMRKVVISD